MAPHVNYVSTVVPWVYTMCANVHTFVVDTENTGSEFEGDCVL